MFMSDEIVGYFFTHTHIYVCVNIYAYNFELYFKDEFSLIKPLI